MLEAHRKEGLISQGQLICTCQIKGHFILSSMELSQQERENNWDITWYNWIYMKIAGYQFDINGFLNEYTRWGPREHDSSVDASVTCWTVGFMGGYKELLYGFKPTNITGGPHLILYTVITYIYMSYQQLPVTSIVCSNLSRHQYRNVNICFKVCIPAHYTNWCIILCHANSNNTHISIYLDLLKEPEKKSKYPLAI